MDWSCWMVICWTLLLAQTIRGMLSKSCGIFLELLGFGKKNPPIYFPGLFVVGFLLKESDLFLMNLTLSRLNVYFPESQGPHDKQIWSKNLVFIFRICCSIFILRGSTSPSCPLLSFRKGTVSTPVRSVALENSVLLKQQCHLHNSPSHLGSFLFTLSEICISISLPCKSLQKPLSHSIFENMKVMIWLFHCLFIHWISDFH